MYHVLFPDVEIQIHMLEAITKKSLSRIVHCKYLIHAKHVTLFSHHILKI